MENNKPAADETKFSDKQTDKRIHEVLMNEEDHITEQDISNIRTDVDNNTGDTPTTEEQLGKEKEPGKLKGDTDPEIDNDSWNILDNG